MIVRVIKGKGPICSPLCGTKTNRDGPFEIEDKTGRAWMKEGLVEVFNGQTAEVVDRGETADRETPSARRSTSLS